MLAGWPSKCSFQRFYIDVDIDTYTMCNSGGWHKEKLGHLSTTRLGRDHGGKPRRFSRLSTRGRAEFRLWSRSSVHNSQLPLFASTGHHYIPGTVLHDPTAPFVSIGVVLGVAAAVRAVVVLLLLGGLATSGQYDGIPGGRTGRRRRG